jgi:hypothetical protein
MGLDNTMWTAVEHDEHEHKEIHFVASLIDYDGQTISDSKDYERAEEIIRRTEEGFGLKRVEPSREAMRRSPTQEEMKYFERTGVVSTRVRLQEHVDAATGHGATVTEMIERLEARDVHMVPYLNQAGEVQDIRYRLDEKLMKGSDLGRGYSWPGLQKEWAKHRELRQGKVTYEHTRDDAAISRAGGREAAYQHESKSRKRGTDAREVRGNIEAPERDSKRLDNIEKNIIIQQPNVLDFTKQVYPHLEAAMMRCDAVEKNLTALEEMVTDYVTHMEKNWQATDAIVEKQKTDFATISQRFQVMALKDLQGKYQEIHADLGRMLEVERACLEAAEECRVLATQCGQDYMTSSKTIEELAETSKKHLTEIKNKSVEAIKESREKYVQTFRKLTWTVGGQPVMAVLTVLVTVVLLSIGATLLANHTLTERTVEKSVEASTQATRETLKPMMKKIEEQTRSLDETYQQSQAFDYFIETLPARERRNKRDELMTGMRRQKLKEAENTQRQTE